MGNRAVITTKSTNPEHENGIDPDAIGVYVHWGGHKEFIAAALAVCKAKGYRSPDSDNYGWARLCQVLANCYPDGLTVGVDTCKRLDCDNWDNGTYLIKGWEIVGGVYSNEWQGKLDEKAYQENYNAIMAAQPEGGA